MPIASWDLSVDKSKLTLCDPSINLRGGRSYSRSPLGQLANQRVRFGSWLCENAKLPTPGRILAIVTIGGQDVLAAGINFELAPADTAVATASARPFADTEAFEQSRRERKKIEMRFAHLKRILRLGRLRLRGTQGAQDEFVLAAIAQNLRRFASLVTRPPPTMALCAA